MPFKEHPVFEQPDDENHVIWRYMDGTQFISLLQKRGLYFNRVDNFEDQFEGIFPKGRLINEYISTKLNQEKKQLLADEGLYPEDIVENNKSAEDELFDALNMFRKNSYINCWHMNDSESMAMWKAYITGGDGVLIKSTYSKLKQSLDIHDDYTYRMGQVSYLPWLDEGIEEDIDERVRSNWLYPFTYKQEEYEYEEEIRALIGFEDRNKIDDDTTGFFVKTDLNNLIDSVVVSPTSPPWSDVEFWENICRKYSLRTNVETSTLEVTPEAILSEIDDQEINKTVQKLLERWQEEQDFIS